MTEKENLVEIRCCSLGGLYREATREQYKAGTSQPLFWRFGAIEVEIKHLYWVGHEKGKLEFYYRNSRAEDGLGEYYLVPERDLITFD